MKGDFDEVRGGTCPPRGIFVSGDRRKVVCGHLFDQFEWNDCCGVKEFFKIHLRQKTEGCIPESFIGN
jgi:hypothetical protein